MYNKIYTNRIFGKIVGEDNPVFVAFNDAIRWPLLASFDGEDEKKYIILEIGPYTKGFRYFYADDDCICLEQDLTADEAKNIKLALGMIIASIFYTEGLPEKLSDLDYLTSAAYAVCEMSSNTKGLDLVEEISKLSGIDIDKVTSILLDLSNISLNVNSNGGH